MTLQAELDAFKAIWTERVGADIAEMMTADNAALLPLAARAVTAGAAFPSIALADHLGNTVDIAGLAEEKPLIVTFYRGGWCPYCNLELRAYQELLPAIKKRGARLIAVSPETPDDTLSTAETNNLAFTVLSDARGRLADALGIRFELSDAVIAYFKKAGHDLPKRNGDDRWSLPMPATYIIAKGGRIFLAHVDPDYRARLDPAAVLDVLDKLRTEKAA